MEGRVCSEYRWGLKSVLVYALCHTKPILDFDYHNKWSNTLNNMSSVKRSNTYWSTNAFAPSVAICIARIICHRLSAAICIGRPICLYTSAAICIDRSICHRWRAVIICIGQPILYPESAAICIDYANMPPSSIWFTKYIDIHIVLSKVWSFHIVHIVHISHSLRSYLPLIICLLHHTTRPCKPCPRWMSICLSSYLPIYKHAIMRSW